MEHPAKQKLVYILHELAVGGVEVAFLSALPNLHASFELRVYVLGSASPALLSGLPEDIKKTLSCYSCPSWMMPLYLPALLLTIYRFKPDIIVSSLWRSALAATWYKRLRPGVRYFLFMHSSVYFHRPDRVFTQRAIKKADIILADSHASKAFASKTAPPGTPLIVVPLLVQPSPDHINIPAFSGPAHFFFMGRLNEVKNVPLAIAAIAWLRRQGVEADLDIYGRDNGDLPAIRQAIQQERMEAHIRLQGEVDPRQKEAIYTRYNFYIQLSRDEGMAMSVAEAMQHGAVCFVTSVGEIPRYARDRVSAVFLQTAGHQEWQLSLQKMLDTVRDPDLCTQISRAAFQTFRETPLYKDAIVHVIREYGKQKEEKNG